jgi:hypothetical protein
MNQEIADDDIEALDNFAEVTMRHVGCDRFGTVTAVSEITVSGDDVDDIYPMMKAFRKLLHAAGYTWVNSIDIHGHRID